MPKEFQIYRDFSGGANNRTNPKDIKDNELVTCNGMIGDELGKLRTTSPPVRVVSNLTSGDAIVPGRGLFVFSSDYSFADSDGDSAVRSSQYICSCDAGDSQIDVYGYDDTANALEKNENTIDLGAGTSMTAEYYYHDGVLRVCDATFDAANTVHWFGRIGGASAKQLLGTAIPLQWYATKQTLPSPTRGWVSASLTGVAHADSTTTQLKQTGTSEITGQITAYADVAGVLTTCTSVGVQAKGLSVNDSITISGTTSYEGEWTVVAVDTDTFTIAKGFVENDAAGSWVRPGGNLNFQDFDTASYGTTYKQYYFAQDKGTGKIYRITGSNSSLEYLTTDANADHDWETAAGGFRIFSYPGSGFAVEVTESQALKTGSWTIGIYEYSSTFIYEGEQESLPYTMNGVVEISANQVLYVRVFMGGLDSASEWETMDAQVTGPAQGNDARKRIIGGRIYTRKQGSNNKWSLLLDMDLRVDNSGSGGGVRKNTFSAYEPWIEQSCVAGNVTDSNLTASNIKAFYSVQFTIKSPSPESYENLNGFAVSENRICFGDTAGNGWKASVNTGTRMFVANTNYFDDLGGGASQVMGDAIFYSPVGKMDTFPSSWRLDVQMLGSDGDEFTALGYFDMSLFAFKKKYLYMVDISSPMPSGWTFKGKYLGMGVHSPSAVIEVAGGLAWVNTSGLFIYAGGKINNVSGAKNSNAEWRDFIGESPVLGYDTSGHKIIIVDNSTKASGVTSHWKIFDMQTQSFFSSPDILSNVTRNFWGLIYNQSAKNTAMTNIVSFKGDSGDLNFNLDGGCIALYDNDAETVTSDADIVSLDLSPTGHSQFEVVFKDDDFGKPAHIKKIYEVNIEYLTDDGASPVNVYYRLNGDVTETQIHTEQVLSGNASMTNVNVLQHKFTPPVKGRSFQLRIASGTPVNLIANPDFELAGTPLLNWLETSASGATWSRANDESMSGYSAKCINAATMGSSASIISDNFNLTPGKTYTLSWWGRFTINPEPTIRFLNVTDTHYLQDDMSFSASSNFPDWSLFGDADAVNQWHYYTLSFTVPSTYDAADNWSVAFYPTTTGNNVTYIDNVKLGAEMKLEILSISTVYRARGSDYISTETAGDS